MHACKKRPITAFACGMREKSGRCYCANEQAGLTFGFFVFASLSSNTHSRVCLILPAVTRHHNVMELYHCEVNLAELMEVLDDVRWQYEICFAFGFWLLAFGFLA